MSLSVSKSITAHRWTFTECQDAVASITYILTQTPCRRSPQQKNTSNNRILLMAKRHKWSLQVHLHDLPLCYAEPERLLDWAVNSCITALQHFCYQHLFRACLVHQVTAALCYADSLHKTTQPRSCPIIFSTQEEVIKLTTKLTGKIKVKEKNRKIGKVPFTISFIYKYLGRNCYNFTVSLKLAVEWK